jgi:hypothetical protein
VHELGRFEILVLSFFNFISLNTSTRVAVFARERVFFFFVI